MIRELEIVRPDDWHLHLRDGTILKAVLPYTSKTFGRAIVMPNLTPLDAQDKATSGILSVE